MLGLARDRACSRKLAPLKPEQRGRELDERPSQRRTGGRGRRGDRRRNEAGPSTELDHLTALEQAALPQSLVEGPSEGTPLEGGMRAAKEV